MNIKEQRDQVTKVAHEWCGTPYHHGSHIKGLGTSCSWFVAGVYNEALGLNLGVPEHFEQWYLNENRERYLEGLEEQGFVRVTREQVQPADVLVSRTCYKHYCHGGILLDWPRAIHVASTRGVIVARNLYASWYFGQCPDSLLFYSWKGWHV